MAKSRILTTTAVIFFTASAALADLGSGDTITFTGADDNWYSPGNWDLGRLPQAGDDVVIGGGRSVIIDPARDPMRSTSTSASLVQIQDLYVTDGASLETLAGTMLSTRNEDLSDGGQLIHRATHAFDHPLGGTLTALDACSASNSTCPGVNLNPTPKSKRDVILQSSITFGLGGTLPAANTSIGARGAGHYATLTCETVALGGLLKIATYYDFAPTPGDSFEIITVTGSRTGEFAGLTEGSLVDSFGDVGLYLSYRGGDGNDVVLTAAALVKSE